MTLSWEQFNSAAYFTVIEMADKVIATVLTFQSCKIPQLTSVLVSDKLLNSWMCYPS